MEVITILAMGFVCAACFLTGAKVGQAVSKGEEIKTPTVNPLKAYREMEAKKEAKAEQDRIDTIMRNIESYDGTGHGQEDVPGR
jgi:hypothetical protein